MIALISNTMPAGKTLYSPLGNPNSPNNQLIDLTAPSHRAYPSQITGETFESWTIDIPNNTGYNPWPTGSTTPPPVGEQLPNAGVNSQAYTGSIWWYFAFLSSCSWRSCPYVICKSQFNL